MIKSEKNINVFFWGLIGAVVVSGIFICGYFFGLERQVQGLTADSNSFDTGYKAALTELSDSGMINFSEEKYRIAGIIKQMKDNSLIIELMKDPVMRYTPQIREILISDATKILNAIPKNEGIYRNEINHYISQVKNNIRVAVPSRNEYASINFNQLQENDQVYVEANENIFDKQSFTAEKITTSK